VEDTVRRNLRADDAVIVDYEPRHRAAFRDLNLAWITTHFRVEAADRRALGDPDGYILARGGHILVAELDGVAVGVCALLRQEDGSFELAKMAVDPAAQGRRIGWALGRAAIERARALGAPRVELLSNTVLEPAIRLYRALGFVEVPLPETEYERANIKMVLELEGER
jgi:ribosomal protein S18 acetylase RimI-like enzyme